MQRLEPGGLLKTADENKLPESRICRRNRIPAVERRHRSSAATQRGGCYGINED